MGVRGIGAVVAVAGVWLGALAGPLTPPAGAPASTGRTTLEIEPRVPMSQATTPGDAFTVFRIDEPGSYYLTEDLVVPSNKEGIDIRAACTIDLNGFTISGGSALSAIVVDLASDESARIHNGHMRNFGAGIRFGNAANGLHVHDMSFKNVGAVAISAGVGCIVERCTVEDADIAFVVDRNSIVRDCTVRGAIQRAVSAAGGCVLENVTVLESGVAGLAAVSVGQGSLVRGVVVQDVEDRAIVVGEGGVVERVSVVNAGSVARSAVRLAPGCVARGLTVRGSRGVGISADGGVLRDVVVETSTGVGLALGDRMLVERALVVDGSADGVLVGSRSQVRDSTIANNSGRGILVRDGASVVAIEGCLLQQNGAGAIGLAGASGVSVSIARSKVVGAFGQAGVIELDRLSSVVDCDLLDASITMIADQNVVHGCRFIGGTIQIDGIFNSVTSTLFSVGASIVDNQPGSNNAVAPVAVPASYWGNFRQ